MSVFVCKGHFWWRQTRCHLHVTLLQCLDKFSNLLVRWSIRMIRAKNYETVSKFVKVMTKILWPLFSGHGANVRTRTYSQRRMPSCRERRGSAGYRNCFCVTAYIQHRSTAITITTMLCKFICFSSIHGTRRPKKRHYVGVTKFNPNTAQWKRNGQKKAVC